MGVDISPDMAASAKNGLSNRNGTTFMLLLAQPKPSPCQVCLTACCCSRRTRRSPRQKPSITCLPISKRGRGSCHSGPNSQTRDEADY